MWNEPSVTGSEQYLNIYLIGKMGNGGMVPQLRRLAILPQDLGSINSTHKVAQNHMLTPVPGISVVLRRTYKGEAKHLDK